MAGRYERWLIAKGHFAPGSLAVAKLVERLRKEKWIPPGGGHAITTIDNEYGDDDAKKKAAQTKPLPAVIDKEWLDDPDREELRLVWNVKGDDVTYPLTSKPDGAASYAFEIHRAGEYVCPVAKTITPLPTICNCGEDISFAWDPEEVVCAFERSTGIFTECEECSRTFDPSKVTSTITNPFDGSKEEVRGGGAYRFAIKIDCGSSYVEDARLAFSPALVALLENEFNRSFYEIGVVN
ncbi:MAG: hypothetical protein JST00_21250 [Deltaproteobacteria bacterium]|nr:hypothetical protein [Deltaproteobacteria bacterium]